MADEGGMADESGKAADAAGDAEMAIPDEDADLLVAEAVRLREEQRSGRPMARQFLLVAGCAVVGLLLVVGGGSLGNVVGVVALVAGVLMSAVTGLLLVRALDLSPATQWGEPVLAPCPACGERGLREDRVAVPWANGIVALCAPECGYAEVRPDPDGSRDPDGPSGPSGSRRPWRGLAGRT